MIRSPFKRQAESHVPAPSREALREIVRVGSIAESALHSPLYEWIVQELSNRAQARLRALLDSQSSDLLINDGLRRSCKEAEESIQFIQSLIDTAVVHKRQAVELLNLADEDIDVAEDDLNFNPDLEQPQT